MYRKIEGYEKALYLASEIEDNIEELKRNLEYGESVTNVLTEVSNIEFTIMKIRSVVEKGNGKRN